MGEIVSLKFEVLHFCDFGVDASTGVVAAILLLPFLGADSGIAFSSEALTDEMGVSGGTEP